MIFEDSQRSLRKIAYALDARAGCLTWVAGTAETRRSGETTERGRKDSEVGRTDTTITVVIVDFIGGSKRHREGSEVRRSNTEIVVDVCIADVAIPVEVRIALCRIGYARAIVETVDDSIAVSINNGSGPYAE
jgi:hypothetical protein